MRGPPRSVGAAGARSLAAWPAAWSVPSWLSTSALMPSARLVIAETAATRRPQWRAAMISGTVDMPTASAPSDAERADLGGGLEARARDREVDALGEVDGGLGRGRRAGARAARGRTRRAGSEARPDPVVVGPTSGLRPIMLMWSVSAMSRPGPTSARSEPAAFVSRISSAPSARTVRTGTAIARRIDALVEVRAALEDRDRDAGERAEHEAPGVAGDAPDREARELGVGDRDARPAPRRRRAPRPEPSTRPARGAGALAGRRSRTTVGGVGHAGGRSCVEGERQQLAERHASAGCPPGRRGGRASSGVARARRRRWRQPPHGVMSSVSAMTTTSRIRRPPPATSAPIADVSAHWPWG